MRIHEIEIYTAKQIRAFIQYLDVLATEREAQEEMQKQFAPTQGFLMGGINAGSAIAPTPEGMARAAAAQKAMAEAKEPA